MRYKLKSPSRIKNYDKFIRQREYLCSVYGYTSDNYYTWDYRRYEAQLGTLPLYNLIYIAYKMIVIKG